MADSIVDLQVSAPPIIVKISPQVAAALIVSTVAFRTEVTPAPLSSAPDRQ